MSDDSAQVTTVDFKKTQRFEGIAALEAYWQSVRGTRDVPLRADIDPRGIEAALDFSFIVERVTAGIIRFRLAGSQLNELMGMDVRGMPITSFIGTASRAEVLDAIEKVFSGPEVIEFGLESPGGPGKPALPGQMILLPLKSDLGDVSRAIGCFPTRGQMGNAPRRFELSTTIQRKPLRSLDTAEQPIITRRPAPAPKIAGFAEEKQAFEGPKKSPAERPYLRLVRDDDGED